MILSPVSLSVAWDVRVIRVIWGFNFIRGFRVIWVFVVIIFVGRFEIVVCLLQVLDSIVCEPLHLAFIIFSLLLPV